MEAQLTGLSEIYSRTENLEVTEEADVDEDIPMYFTKEQKTQAYKKTMDIDIDKIETFENINKVNTIKIEANL